jgi:hypothetical protein
MKTSRRLGKGIRRRRALGNRAFLNSSHLDFRRLPTVLTVLRALAGKIHAEARLADSTVSGRPSVRSRNHLLASTVAKPRGDNNHAMTERDN